MTVNKIARRTKEFYKVHIDGGSYPIPYDKVLAHYTWVWYAPENEGELLNQLTRILEEDDENEKNN